MSSRKSNVELLRILLFFMVVAIHISGPYLTNNHVVGSFNWQFANLLDGGSRVAVNCFVLITGYFTIDIQKGIGKQIKKLLGTAVVCGLPYLLLYGMEQHSLVAIWYWLRDFCKGEGYFYHLWFLQTIVVTYVFVPFYTKLLKQLTKKEYQSLLFCMFVIFSAIPTLGYIMDYQIFDTTLFVSRLSLFLLLFALGGYIKTFPPSFSLKQCALGFALAEGAILFVTAWYNYKWSPLIFFYQLRGITLTYPLPGFTGPAYEYNSVFVLVASISLFLLVLQKDFYSPIVNGISKYVFPAYILHVFWITVGSKSELLSPFIRYDQTSYPLSILCFLVVVGSCSLLSCVLLMKLQTLLLKTKKRLQ